MNNYDLIKEFIQGDKEYNAYCHLGYKNNELVNYGTTLVLIDRTNKKAKVNNHKYSRSTTNIQNMIDSLLNNEKYNIEYFDGGNCTYWNYGYCGAGNITINDVKKW